MQAPADSPHYSSPATAYIADTIADSLGGSHHWREIQHLIVLADPSKPGDNYAEQIVNEAKRLAPEWTMLEPEVRGELLYALMHYTHDADGNYNVECPKCALRISHFPRGQLATGPIAQAILARLLYKHWMGAHNGA